MTRAQATIRFPLPWIAAALMVVLASCGYLHHAGPLRPVPEQPGAMIVADDGSVTYQKGRFEVKLRPFSDTELNRQFSTESQNGVKSTNPFTYGDVEFKDKERQRFIVFSLSVKNYAYPKVRIDPARIVLRASNGREYWSLSERQIDTYFRVYAIGYAGNAYIQYKNRLDLVKRTLFRNEDIFSGQESEGFVVFPVLHHDVRQIEAIVQDAMLRFDYRDEPVEMMDIGYQFERDVGRRYRDGNIELSAQP
ncbi:MAG TPA: hypothetical protein QGF95_25115 [Candidatus Latescibacteria bacterium]|jgi:hypothetical protein|nr:hypothetical protein [Candidatus Latescibacterota bacterium]HJP33847.1 hypothetical protein [Candidatus Latescibacterota bacterium]